MVVFKLTAVIPGDPETISGASDGFRIKPGMTEVGLNPEVGASPE
jgi:hypothetical protein